MRTFFIEVFERAIDAVGFVLVYSALALAAVYVLDVKFANALFALCAARVLVMPIDAITAAIAWRLRGNSVNTKRYLAYLRDNRFPPRVYRHDRIDDYLIRLQRDTVYPTALRMAAIQLATSLDTAELLDGPHGARLRLAADAALEIHSPSAQAPVYARAP